MIQAKTLPFSFNYVSSILIILPYYLCYIHNSVKGKGNPKHFQVLSSYTKFAKYIPQIPFYWDPQRRLIRKVRRPLKLKGIPISLVLFIFLGTLGPTFLKMVYLIVIRCMAPNDPFNFQQHPTHPRCRDGLSWTWRGLGVPHSSIPIP